MTGAHLLGQPFRAGSFSGGEAGGKPHSLGRQVAGVATPGETDNDLLILSTRILLDGGLRFYKLQAETGKVLAVTPMDEKDPATGKQVHSLLYANWAGAQLFKSQGLVVHIEAEVDATGRVGNVRVVRSSGSRQFDESAERAILKVQPFPPPPRGALTLTLTFDPREAA